MRTVEKATTAVHTIEGAMPGSAVARPSHTTYSSRLSASSPVVLIVVFPFSRSY
jgi:hypothetical protein